jgi:hypothetical protein
VGQCILTVLVELHIINIVRAKTFCGQSVKLCTSSRIRGCHLHSGMEDWGNEEDIGPADPHIDLHLDLGPPQMRPLSEKNRLDLVPTKHGGLQHALAPSCKVDMVCDIERAKET